MSVANVKTSGIFTVNKIQRGAHQQYHILAFAVDRTNLFVGRVEKHVYEPWDSPDPGLLSLTYGTNTVGADCGIRSLATGGKGYPLCVGIERRYDDAQSMAIYTYTFEGIATNHGQKFKEFELEFTMEQAPIETHPNFQALNDTYGPYDSLNRTWPPIVTAASASKGLNKPTTTKGPTTNPMYGVTSYLVPGCTYRVTYSNPDVDKGLLDGIGTIDPSPDDINDVFGVFNSMISNAGADHKWLKMAPKVRQHGGCVTVTEEWLLSGPRGWISQVYDLKSSGGGGGPLGGLTPGL